VSDVLPALTAEEWERIASGVTRVSISAGDVLFQGRRITGRPSVPAIRVDADTEPHALAALALYGQPFGFHIKDVDFLRSLRHIEADDLASRIEALLPPRIDETQAPETR
jgi:hypothetical protein